MKPHPVTSLLDQGRRLHAARDVAGAAGLYGRALALAPQHADAQHLYGLAVLELGQYEMGLACIRRAAALAPGEAVIRFNLGRALLLGGQAAAAADAFGDAARLNPGHAKAWLQRAALLDALQRPADAVPAWRGAVAADARSVPAWCGLARALYEVDDLPGAMAAQQRAVALDESVMADGPIGFARCTVAPDPARHAAAAAHCTGPGGAAAASAREMVIVDDFLPDPLAYRRAALALAYTDRSASGVNYPGLQTAPAFEPTLMQRLADAAGFDLKWGWPDHGAFRLSPADARARSDIHVDDAEGRPTFAAVLYLTRPEYCRGGTSFWRHRATGWEQAPDAAALQAQGFASLEAFHRTLDPPSGSAGFEDLRRGRADWDLVLEVPMRMNRLVLYRADHYHAISDVFGHGPDDARLVQLFFFERMGRPAPWTAGAAAGT